MKYLILIFGVLAFTLSGFNSCRSAYMSYTRNSAMHEENNQLVVALEEAKGKRDTAAAALRDAGIQVAESNLDLAESISMAASASIVYIDAEYKDDIGYNKIVSASNVSDVAFFSSDVQYMNFCLSSTDIDATVKSIMGLSLQITSLELDYETNTVYLRVPTIFISGEDGGSVE